jgi:Peptidase E
MKNILLTSAGLSENLEEFFWKKIKKKPSEIKVIFVPSASTHSDDAREGISLCMFKLINMGILPENIFVYHLGYLLSKNYTRTYSSEVTNVPPLFRLLSVEEMNKYDMLIFSGGEASILLSEINRTGFHEVIKQAVENGLFYLGISAGSMVAAGNFSDSLGYVRNTIFVHCEEGTLPGDLPQDVEIYLTDTQAIWIGENSAQIIE